MTTPDDEPMSEQEQEFIKTAERALERIVEREGLREGQPLIVTIPMVAWEITAEKYGAKGPMPARYRRASSPDEQVAVLFHPNDKAQQEKLAADFALFQHEVHGEIEH
jgi:hypothetical protein